MITKYKISNINDASIVYDEVTFETVEDFEKEMYLKSEHDTRFVDSELDALIYIKLRLKSLATSILKQAAKLQEEESRIRKSLIEFDKAIDAIREN